jgi:hypothetical protein
MLQLIEYKNRIWLFFLVIPIAFFLFISTFFLYFYFRSDESVIWFYLTFAIFLVEMQLITIFVSRLRYVPYGQINFDDRGVSSENSSFNLDLSWNKINSVKFYYRGDKFWKLKLFGITFIHGKRRYRNLNWIAVKGMNEKVIDRIDINGNPLYVKIRNETEKNIFHQFIAISNSKLDDVQIMETDFSHKLFGRVFDGKF